MQTEIEQEYRYFKDAIFSVSSSLDLRKAMRSTYQFFSAHFPIDGVSLHVFRPEQRAMHLLFLVTEKEFHYLDMLVDLPQKAIDRLTEQEKERRSIVIPHTFQSPGASRTGKALDPYLPDKDRARLIVLLFSEDKIIGHFSLIGPEPECFTKEDERKLSILRPALSLFMMNLLRYQEISELKNRLEEENLNLVNEVRSFKETAIAGAEGGLKPILSMVEQVARQEIPVLITGETGTGKELIADAIQRRSVRADAPYIKVNCGAIPGTLMDSELFGHEKGAFTGATKTKPGRFEQAHGGTLFLDEIGDMSLEAQVRLLRVLQNGIVHRVGGIDNIYVDVRIIAATHRDLKTLMREGRFREDLFYRLNVFPIHLPPLRDRQADINELAHYFINRRARQLGIDKPIKLAEESLPALQSHHWPGNIRELENLVERALATDSSNPIQLHSYLPTTSPQVIEVTPQPEPESKALSVRSEYLADNLVDASKVGLPQFLKSARESFPALDQVTREHIELALQLCNGKVYGQDGAADLLGVNPNTLRKRMDKLGILYGRRR